jgi:hypothetical protein
MYNLRFGLWHMAKYVVRSRALSYEEAGQDNACNGKDTYSNALDFSGSLILEIAHVMTVFKTSRSPFFFIDAHERGASSPLE